MYSLKNEVKEYFHDIEKDKESLCKSIEDKFDHTILSTIAEK
jgi:hypothetical protein